jgi:23S rRNA (cytosine1962-C5)-methyltransferase
VHSLGVDHRARLRKPLEQALRSGHPWVWRDAVDVDAPAGAVVTLVDGRGKFVARGIADAGPIGVRVWTTDDEAVDRGMLERRIARAAELRDRVLPPDTTAYRLVHGEGDRLPGIVCDVYGAYATMQLDGEGIGAWREVVAEVLWSALAPRGVTALLWKIGRGETRQIEVLRGAMPADAIEVREHGMTLLCDLMHGQKTGMFLDHRESRARVRAMARGLRVLNLFGYTGGFSIAAGLGGAERVVTVDVSPGAIQLANDGWAKNGLEPARHQSVVEDVPAFLERVAREGARWDLVVCDPPSYAPSEAAVGRAIASYRALHTGCLRVLAPGGLYLAASCSSHVDRESFEQTVAEAARKSGKVVQVLERSGAPADHPRLLAFPEGDYLKVLLCRVP